MCCVLFLCVCVCEFVGCVCLCVWLCCVVVLLCVEVWCCCYIVVLLNVSMGGVCDGGCVFR